MELSWTNIGDSCGTGEQIITVPPGKFLKIESTPDGEELLNNETPMEHSITYHIKVIARKVTI